MMKFVYMIKMPNLDPEHFIGTFEDADNCIVVVGMDNKDTAKELFQKYVAEGFALFNLCSGFTPEDAAEFEALAEGTKVRAAVYNEEQAAKIGALKDFSKYGAIFVTPDVKETEEIHCAGPGFETTAMLIKDQETANAAAQKLVGDGATFMELCSWFDTEKTQSVVDAIDGAVPVGSCGL